MRADGVPLGSVQPQTTSGALIYDQASSPMAKISLRDRDAVVLDMAGTALTYVHPSSQRRACRGLRRALARPRRAARHLYVLVAIANFC